ncbi:MAG: DUF72 domain-containing protein [Sphingobacteriales bacterium]|nr:MAG: DUF72 domain-containing protein [Sphingobacteriales bacterium]
MSQIQNYYLGCPIWANKDWVGSLFTAKAKPKDYLRQYAQVFNSVEGSNTFYALPNKEQVLRWYSDTPSGFRFSFKFPQTITHIHKLHRTQEEVTRFFKTMEPLQSLIGTYFIQLPPSFNRKGLPALKTFIQQLPKEFTYAAEVRHPDFFMNDETELHFNRLLEDNNINRAIFDTSSLHNIEAKDDITKEAQRKKPKMPERFVATAGHPFLRFCGHSLPPENQERLTLIAGIVANWISEGKQPYLFIHTPGDELAPQTCRLFHQLLSKQIVSFPVGNIPPFPGEYAKDHLEQMSLF